MQPLTSAVVLRRRLSLVWRLVAGTGLVALLAACAVGAGGSGARSSNGPSLPGSPSGTPGAPTADLEVVVVRAPGEPGQRWTLRCAGGDPLPGSTHPAAASACALVAAHPGLLGPPPKDRVCTQLYGGPDVATVSGTVDGAPVSRQFTRTDGCGVADWAAAQALLGPPGDAL
ncbi:hypothetical protein GCM10012320_06580 [Sinomonas cellulolyticus]|uniref:Serine protease inhibitor n=1 Tax=Sinomonas cellulolyticus TaxID=2801916 RepID=A0ABS1K387_9MICC|nr:MULTISPECIES: SSI family serine proteinase inhibitor [Sinomonas]MBL0705985.1 serine protease inhibitor [Sinomonas cellulolyticus]GHG42933.1 hypothetical protein GCM10012320_06580 [Sinomonas sp. KCTC 49339]